MSREAHICFYVNPNKCRERKLSCYNKFDFGLNKL
jgi:hypothetical protein